MLRAQQYGGVRFAEVDFTELRFFLFVVLFVAADVTFPYFFHHVPMGGPMFLPIYFFTLVAGYSFGWRVGVTTAVLSVSMSYMLSGMPPLPVLHFVMFKSAMLGISSGLAARYLRLPIFVNVFIAIVAYQLAGSLFEWVLTGSLSVALADVSIGYPGLLLQLIGGAVIINIIGRYGRKIPQGNSGENQGDSVR